MEIIKKGTLDTFDGPEDWFTGNVKVDLIFPQKDVTKASGYLVSFEAGARTAWHKHPAGQMIIIQSGLGWVQKEGGPVKEVYPGDVVWFDADERHWHGASAEQGMSHLAIQEEKDGTTVYWMEKVNDTDYQK